MVFAPVHVASRRFDLLPFQRRRIGYQGASAHFYLAFSAEKRNGAVACRRNVKDGRAIAVAHGQMWHILSVGGNNVSWTVQQMGSDWYNSRKSLLLRVPSSVIPKEYNYLINTRHPDYPENVALVRQEGYVWDERLMG